LETGGLFEVTEAIDAPLDVEYVAVMEQPSECVDVPRSIGVFGGA